MRSVLISIRPKWCEKIFMGYKTIEIRKTQPNLPTPFKAYIYCTVGGDEKWLAGVIGQRKPYKLNGTVCAEFICDHITPVMNEPSDLVWAEARAKIPPKDLATYIGNKKHVYGWHIASLNVYDQPKTLNDFIPSCRFLMDGGMECCDFQKIECSYQEYDHNPDGSLNTVSCVKKLTRPPQSWCYVET